MGSWKHPENLRHELQTTTERSNELQMNTEPRRERSTGFSQLNTMNKLRFKAGEHLDINIANHFSRLSDVPRYDRLIQKKNGILRYGDWYYGPQGWMMNNAVLDYTRKSPLYDEVKMTVAHQDYRESRHDRKIFDTILNEQTEKVAIWSLNLDFDKALGKGRSLVYYGAEYVRNDIKSTADVRNEISGTVSPAGS